MSSATVMSAGALSGCEGDEQEPTTHVERLDDPMTRPAAVKRLIQFYEDAMTKDDKNREGPNVKPLLEKIVPPLTELAVKGELDQRSQGDLLAFLADSRDERALPALIKALKDYRMDDKRAEKYDSQMAEVVRNLGEMVKAGKIKGNKEVNDSLFDLFTKMHASYPKAQNAFFYRLLNNTLVNIADPSWEGQLVGMLERPIKSNQPKFAKAYHDEVYWQITASEILGALKSEKAVRPLIKVVLTPFKGDVVSTAIIALIRIGKPALEAAVKLMKGEDDELKKYAEEEYIRDLEDAEQKVDDNAKKAAAAAYLNEGVRVVGNIGTKDCLQPMLDAIAAGEPVIKATVASQLSNVPFDDTVKTTFKDIYLKTDVALKIPPDSYAKEALIEAAISFFDQETMGWVLQDAVGLKGTKEDVEGVQAMVLGVGLKAANAAQWPLVEQLVLKLPKIETKNDKYFVKQADKKQEEGPLTDKDVVAKIENLELKNATAREAKEGAVLTPLHELPAFAGAVQKAQYINAVRVAKKVLDECGSGLDCYYGKLTSPEATKQETAVVGEKAAYMIGMFGGPEVKAKLVEMLPRIRSAGVRNIIGLILVAKSPQGDPDVSKKLQEMLEQAEESRQKDKIDEMKAFKLVIYRLQARQG
jgi:HEAT repeat protein